MAVTVNYIGGTASGLSVNWNNKWSGLTGFCTWHDYITDTDAPTVMLANGFTQWRTVPPFQDTTRVADSKTAVIAGNAAGLQAIWGVSSFGTTITSSTWPAHRLAILDAAQWAQDNGVYEFQIGNEDEAYVDGTTMTVAQLVTNLKSVATEAQAIFTRGNISYSMYTQSAWVSAGRGDIDLIGINWYRNINESDADWKWNVFSAFNTFGADHSYVTEFNVWATTYGTEAAMADGVSDMIAYLREIGMQRAIFYSWREADFGALRLNGTYTPTWNILIGT